MDATKRKALEKTGWKVADAADFLELSATERQLLDMRVNIALAGDECRGEANPMPPKPSV